MKKTKEAKAHSKWYSAYRALMDALLASGLRDDNIVKYFLEALSSEQVMELARKLKIKLALGPRNWSPRGSEGHLDLVMERIQQYLQHDLHNLSMRSYVLATMFTTDELLALADEVKQY